MFPYCEGDCGPVPGPGATWFVGNSRSDAVKLDLFYTDDFIGELCAEDGIRLASIGDIGQNKTVGNFTRAAISTMALGVGLCSGPVAAACVLGWGIFDLAVGDRVFNGW